MPHIGEIFPSNYVACHELGGKDVTVTVAKVGIESVQLPEKDEKEDKLVIHFENASKPMICNKTNAKLIATHHGKETEGWVGKAITLYPTTCRAFGAKVECIRVRGKRRGR